MKISTFLLVACFSIAFLSSCKKNETYQCDCEYTDGSTEMTDSNLIGEKSSKEDAEVDCSAHEADLLNSGATSATCTVSVVE